MPPRSRRWPLALALICACGRTDLEGAPPVVLGGATALPAGGAPPVGAAGAAGASGVAGSQGGSSPQGGSAGAPAGGAGASGAPTSFDCPSLVENGASAPMPGLCSTRANRTQASLSQPRGKVKSAALGGRLAGPIAVSKTGRAYLPVDTNESDTALLANLIVVVDPDGSRVFTFDAQGLFSGGPIMTASGDVLLAVRRSAGPALVLISPEGQVLRDEPAPDALLWGTAVGETGLLYAQTYDFAAKLSGMVAFDLDGVRFSVSLPGQSPERVALGPGDVAYVATHDVTPDKLGGLLTSIGPDGAIRWTKPLDGYIDGAPVVRPDGSIVLTIAQANFTRELVVCFEPDGTERFRVDIGGMAVTGREDIAVARDGSMFVYTTSHMLSLDPSGAVRFSLGVPTFGGRGIAVDRDGQVLVSGATVRLLDGRTGAALWDLAPPDPFTCLEPAAPGPDGAVYFAQCNGNAYIASPFAP